MRVLALLGCMAAATAASAPAQTGTGGPGCGSGATVAHPFVGGNGLAGNMFDLAPSTDMTIECMDLHWSIAEPIDVAVWWCPNTVVGNDVNQLGTWQPFATGSAMGKGEDRPTRVVLQTDGTIFRATSTYGIYVEVVSYGTAAGYLRYTDGGPHTYVGAHCAVTSYYGKGAGLTSMTFAHRAWNGILYTEESGPALNIVGACPGLVSMSFSNCTPGGRVAILFGQPGSTVRASDPCAGLQLQLSSPRLARMVTAAPDGTGGFSLNAPTASCGRIVQAMDLVGCKVSNALVL